MKVLFNVHWCFSHRRAGSEKYVHEIAEFLSLQGHECKFLVNSDMGPLVGGYEPYQFGSSEVVVRPKDIKDHAALENELHDWADIVVTHLTNTRNAIEYSRKHDVPVVLIQHNRGQLAMHQVKPEEIALFVYNSEWLKSIVEKTLRPRDSLVLVPPLRVSDYECPSENKSMVTHINCNEGKGVMFSRHYASQLPDTPFLFVLGSYFVQHVPRGTSRKYKFSGVKFKEMEFPANCEFWPNTSMVVDEVYSRTKILLQPSIIDTWGYAAIEAMCSGIPVIAHPDAGFLESLGSAGLFAERQKSKTWEALIKRLLTDEDFYAERSQIARQRALSLEHLYLTQLLELQARMEALVEKGGF